MDDQHSPIPVDGAWEGELERALAEQRARTRDFLASHRRRAGALREALQHGVEQLCKETANERERAGEAHSAAEAARQRLNEDQLRLRQESQALAELRRAGDADAEDLTRQRKRVAEKLAALELERDELEAERTRTRAQRKRIALELRAERQAQLQELARREQEIQQAQDRLQAAQPALDEMAALVDGRAQLERQLAERTLQAEIAERRAQELTAERDVLQNCLAEAAERLSGGEESQAQTRRLEAARDKLAQQLADTEARLAQCVAQLAEAPQAPADSASLEDMRRRYEMAMEDLRDLKKRNAELEKRSHAAPAAAIEGMDWEAQKKRMLASWEADSDSGSPEERRERINMRELVNKTDALLAAKDREIDEFKAQLESQVGNPSATLGAAMSDILSQDEILKTERERIQRLRSEWEDKLRQAEIDLSVERAKLARERAEVEERQRVWQQSQSQHPVEPEGAAQAGKAPKPVRGRWLTRLGLKEQDET